MVDDATVQIVAAASSSSVRDICFTELEAERDRDGFVMVLGEGVQGRVFAYKYAWDQSLVAVKEILLSKSKAAQEREEIKSMLAIWHLACVASPYVCRMHGVCWRDSAAMVVMDRHELNLKSYVEGSHPAGLPHQEALRIAFELACGLEALHTRAKSMHLDVKPENVMLAGESLTVCLVDFGLSKGIRANLSSTRVAPGTSGYAAPEQLLENKGNAKADVYGLGATLLYVCTGKTPCQGMTPVQVGVALQNANHVPIPEELKNEEMCSLIRTLTARDPAARPTMQEARQLLERLQRPGGRLDECPVMFAPFEAEGSRVPIILQCCFRNISLEGLQRLLTVGPRRCPSCRVSLPDQPADEFFINDGIVRMLKPRQGVKADSAVQPEAAEKAEAATKTEGAVETEATEADVQPHQALAKAAMRAANAEPRAESLVDRANKLVDCTRTKAAHPELQHGARWSDGGEWPGRAGHPARLVQGTSSGPGMYSYYTPYNMGASTPGFTPWFPGQFVKTEGAVGTEATEAHIQPHQAISKAAWRAAHAEPKAESFLDTINKRTKAANPDLPYQARWSGGGEWPVRAGHPARRIQGTSSGPGMLPYNPPSNTNVSTPEFAPKVPGRSWLDDHLQRAAAALHVLPPHAAVRSGASPPHLPDTPDKCMVRILWL